MSQHLRAPKATINIEMPMPPKPEKDEPVKVPLEPEEALRALMQVRPDDDDHGVTESQTSKRRPEPKKPAGSVPR